MKRVKKSAKILFLLSAAFLLATMFTPIPNMLARPLIVNGPVLNEAGLIAVLGGGAYPNGALGSASNERLIKGVLLYKRGHAKKIVFTGGMVHGAFGKLGNTVLGARPAEPLPEASIMGAIAREFGIPTEDMAVDQGSLNTYENLRFVKAYMEDNGLKTVMIVTSPTHMRRASLVAQKLGLIYISAPVEDNTPYRTSAIDRLALTREVMWEYLGIALYRMYGYV
ncbi:MAG: YdcF family protein [Deltaproteobacteria bacterium]|nr:YdcF family protein [Deltaproteobacteria bacterium]MBZ0220594.1 YdcF family protein [Deltaproteobacteria bacterium]